MKPTDASRRIRFGCYWTLVEPIWNRVDIYDGPKRFLDGYRAVDPVAGNLLAAHWCQSEVCNGGFSQFFFNSTGVLAPEAVIGFRALGMPQTAGTVVRAMAFFGDSYPRTRELRHAMTGTFTTTDLCRSDPFKELDPEFWRLLETENGGFDAAANAYARRHGASSQALL